MTSPPLPTFAQDAAYISNVLERVDTQYVMTHLYDVASQRAFGRQCVDMVCGSAKPTHLDLRAEPSAGMARVLDVLHARTQTLSPAELLIIYVIWIALGEYNINAYRWMLRRDTMHVYIHRLVQNIWAGHYAAQTSASLVHDTDVAFEPALPLPPDHHRLHVDARSDTPSDSRRTRHVLICVERHAMHILYECLCSVRLSSHDMRGITRPFVDHVLSVMETHESHEQSAICMSVMLALHEQCMMSTNAASLLSHIQHRLHTSKPFGENVVYLLNRTPSTTFDGCRFHILVLKLLGAIFTLRETASYFYVNDLKVLVDIFLRQLGDLPDAYDVLRQAYLCVLHALLTQTQLWSVEYKRAHIVRLLTNLVRTASLHDMSERTLTLAQLCLDAEWCVGTDAGNTPLVACLHGEGGIRGASSSSHDHDVIQYMWLLACLQPTAASQACMLGVDADTIPLLWSEYELEDEQEACMPLDFDVRTLESWSRRSSGDAPPHIGNRRRAPPAPPARMPRLAHTLSSASMPELHAHSSSVDPPSPSAASGTVTPPLRRQAPAIPARETPPTGLRAYVQRYWRGKHDDTRHPRRRHVTSHDDFDTPAPRRRAPPPPPPPS